MTVLSLMTKGGWIMMLIAICSIVGAWVYIERIMTYRRLEMKAERLLELIKSLIASDRVSEAEERLAKVDASVAKVVRAGLAQRGKGRDVVREALEAEANHQTHMLEERTSILATVSGVAPLLGFLGTVLGMIKAFQQIESLGGNVNATVLAGGIWEAMVTTAAGLAVGIPAIIAYNHLSTRLGSMIAEMEKAGDDLLALLS